MRPPLDARNLMQPKGFSAAADALLADECRATRCDLQIQRGQPDKWAGDRHRYRRDNDIEYATNSGISGR